MNLKKKWKTVFVLCSRSFANKNKKILIFYIEIFALRESPFNYACIFFCHQTKFVRCSCHHLENYLSIFFLLTHNSYSLDRSKTFACNYVSSHFICYDCFNDNFRLVHFATTTLFWFFFLWFGLFSVLLIINIMRCESGNKLMTRNNYAFSSHWR